MALPSDWTAHYKQEHFEQSVDRPNVYSSLLTVSAIMLVKAVLSFFFLFFPQNSGTAIGQFCLWIVGMAVESPKKILPEALPSRDGNAADILKENNAGIGTL